MKLLKLFSILKTSSFFFRRKNGQTNEIESRKRARSRFTLRFQFDVFRTKEFIEHIFLGERIFLNTLFSGIMVDFFFDMFEKVQREKQDNIITGLK